MKKLSLPSVVCLVLDPLLGLKVKHIYWKISSRLWTPLDIQLGSTKIWSPRTHWASSQVCIPGSINTVCLAEKCLALSYRTELFILISALESGKWRKSLCKSLLSERTSLLISARWAQGKQPSLWWRGLMLTLFPADQKLHLFAFCSFNITFSLVQSSSFPSPLSVLLQETVSHCGSSPRSSLFMSDGGQECTST